MELVTKFFTELTTVELYELLKVRVKIFVVEQKCAYQEIDDIDYRSLHMFYRVGDSITAYLRIFEREKGVIQIGRVLTTEHGKGFGRKILKEAVSLIKKQIKPEKIYLEAQCYAIGFYEKEDFKVCSEKFLEDGIPHVKMILELKKLA